MVNPNLRDYLKSHLSLMLRVISFDQKAMLESAEAPVLVPFAVLFTVYLIMLFLFSLLQFIGIASQITLDARSILGLMKILIMIPFITLAIVLVLFTAVVIAVGMSHLIARLFGGRASFQRFFRACVYCLIPLLCIATPLLFIADVLGALSAAVSTLMEVAVYIGIGLWALVLGIRILKMVHRLNTRRAVVAELLPYMIALLIIILLAIVGILAYSGAY